MGLEVRTRDPFMQLLHAIGLGRPATAGLALVALYLGGVVGVCWLRDWVGGATGGNAYLVQLLNDPVSVVFMLCLAPLFLGFSVRLHTRLTTLFEDLRRSGAWSASEAEAAKFVAERTSFLRSWWLLALAVAVPLLADWGRHAARLAGILPGREDELCLWNGWAHPAGLITSIYFAVFYYALVMVVAKASVASRALRSLFSEANAHRVRVIPLHRDACGGLGAIGGITMTVGSLLLLLGLSAVAYWVLWDLFPHLNHGLPETARLAGQVAFIVAYLAAWVALVGMPLYAAHQHMVAMRDRIEAGIARRGAAVANQFDAVFGDPMRPAPSAPEPDLAHLTETLTALEAAQDYAKRMPVWPVAASGKVHAASTVLAPLVLIVLENVIGEFI